MFPSQFDYVAATSREHAIELLGQLGDDAKVLAGGHSLLPLMKLRLAAPTVIVDIAGLCELEGVDVTNGTIELGALTTYSAVLASTSLAGSVPLLVETSHQVGDVQVRNRGTIGGSVAHADPAGDIPAAMLALGATFTLAGPQGERTVAATDFFRGPFTTALEPDELLVSVSLPARSTGTGSAYEKARNPASGYAVVGVAVTVTVRDELINGVRVALTGAGSQPVRATEVEGTLLNTSAKGDQVADAAQEIGFGVEFLGDSYASPEYRRRLARIHAGRAIMRALQRATS